MKYRYYIDTAIQYLLISIFYPYIQASAMSGRTSTSSGGEMLIWILPLIILFIRWCKAYDKKKRRKRVNK